MNFPEAWNFSSFAVVQRGRHINGFTRESQVHYYVTTLVDRAEATR